MDALALRADEGRDKLRKASGPKNIIKFSKRQNKRKKNMSAFTEIKKYIQTFEKTTFNELPFKFAFPISNVLTFSI